VLFWPVVTLILIVGGIVVAAGIKGALISSFIWPWQSMGVGAVLYIIGRWWRDAPTLLAKARNFALIYAGSLTLLGFIVTLYFGITLDDGVFGLPAAQSKIAHQMIAILSVCLFAWGTVELAVKAFVRARDDISFYGAREALRRWLFTR